MDDEVPWPRVCTMSPPVITLFPRRLISYAVFRVPFGPINNIAQTFEHPQAKARGITVEVDVSVVVSSY